MDRSRFKRRETQTNRQKVETTFGVPIPVAKVVPARPQIQPLQSPRQLSRPQPLANTSDVRQPEPRPAAPLQPVWLQPSRQFGEPRNLAQLTIQAAETTPTPAEPIKPAAPAQILPTTAPESAQPLRSRLPGMDMELPGENSPLRHRDSVLTRGKWAKIRRRAFQGVAVALALFIIGGGLLFSQGYLRLHKVFRGGTATAAALRANVDPELLKGEGDGRVNILLLGRGGGRHDAPDLTDTMMLASIDPVNHTETLVSIPRDLWVDVPNQGAMKINAAWETGEFKYLHRTAPGSTDPNAIQAGFNEVDQAVEDVLGVTIHYNMLINFKAFQQAVDTVNGVTVNVPSDLVDPTMAWENSGNSTLAKAGIQNFNGKQALLYVRSRETTSDFARAQRQRAVLLALKGKVETLGTLSNPLKISGLLNAFGNNVNTDLSLSNATRLYSIIKNISDVNTASVGLADAPNQYVMTGTMAGQSIVLPKAGLFNYKDIQTFIRGQLKDPYILKENAKILVLNGTTTAGLASAKSDELKSYGYNVVGAGNTPGTGWTETTVIDLTNGKDKYTKHYLEQRFNTSAQIHLPDTRIQTNGADFVIIIGSDETAVNSTQAN